MSDWSQRHVSSGLLITSSAIFFLTGGIISVGVFYRFFRLLARQHLREPGFKCFTIPVSDILLFIAWFLFIERIVLNIRISEKLSAIENDNDASSNMCTEPNYSSFLHEMRILNASNMALLWVGELPLFILYFWALKSFPAATWLRISVTIAPAIHTAAFAAALFLDLHILTDGIAAFVFSAVSDVMLLILAFTFLLNPIIILLSTKSQWRWGWVFTVTGISSLVASIVRVIVTRAPESPERYERDMLWMAVQTAAAVVAANAPSFRRLLMPPKNDTEGDGDEQDLQGKDRRNIRDQEAEIEFKETTNKEWEFPFRRHSVESEECRRSAIWG